MAERKLQIGKLQIILFKSSKRVQLALVAVLLLTATALGTLSWVEHRMNRQIQAYQDQAAEISYENECLEKYIDELGTTRSVERIAREELGMVSPDTILIEAQVK